MSKRRIAKSAPKKRRIVTKRVERAANVPERQAIDELLKRYPNSRLASFERKGKAYVAQIKVSEFIEEAPAEDPMLDAPVDPLDDFADELDEPAGDPVEAQLAELTDLVHQIADAVGVSEDPLDGVDVVEEVPLEDDLDAEPVPAEDSDPKFARHADYQKVASRASFRLEREDAGALSNVDLVREATSQFPGFRVAKLDRRAKASDGIAVIDMVRATKKG